MQTIPASEVKRRGFIAIEEKLQNGPVHIVKHNQLKYVVLYEEDYEKLTQSKPKLTLTDLIKKPATGSKTPTQLKKTLKNERSSWSDK